MHMNVYALTGDTDWGGRGGGGDARATGAAERAGWRGGGWRAEGEKRGRADGHQPAMSTELPTCCSLRMRT